MRILGLDSDCSGVEVGGSSVQFSRLSATVRQGFLGLMYLLVMSITHTHIHTHSIT